MHGLPEREVRDLPDPPRNYWRFVGPGIVAGGVGLSSGEFVLWPYIASQVGLILLWGALVGWTLRLDDEATAFRRVGRGAGVRAGEQAGLPAEPAESGGQREDDPGRGVG